ncbi:MAG TPA: glucose 1-dehydrogenase [Amaricoccus sp.]|nr:glucose 1-dehydrogenase [Amaricoccus sp.]
MDLSLARHAALVTGASSGIGRATALALGRAGARVAVNHLPAEAAAAAAVVAEIAAAGGEAMAVAADVSDEAGVEAMLAAVVARFGTLHVLVSNAGIQADAGLLDMSLADWRRVIDVNLTGQFLCARAAVREFLRRGPDPDVSSATGKIVCMSSVHEEIPWAGHANYAASKGGVRMLMRTLAQELAPSRVRVNAVAPGAVRTAINRAVWSTDAGREGMLELIPDGRIGEGEDIARAVLWLASDLSDYVTGATLFVDGGMSLYPAFRGNG